MKCLLSIATMALLFISTLQAQPKEPPKVIKGPIVGKPVKPSVSLPLSEILRRQREKKLAEDANASPERKALNGFLARYPASRSGQVIPVATDELKKLFPKTSFFVLRFRQYPVGILPPKPLKVNNVFAVSGKTVTHLADLPSFTKHFQKNVKAINSKESAENAALAFLNLSREYQQDGFYKFEKPEVKVTVGKGGFVAQGEVKVEQKRGDRGSVTVALSTLEGRLEKVTPGGKLSAGIRPRCQATRLLHPDPVIREIMKRDLIVMGSSAKGYLAEQWSTADPALRKEIEKVWQQILIEGR